MRLLCIFLTACVVFAALKAAIITLVLLFLVSLLWGLYLNPREVAGFLAYCTLLGLVSTHPTLTLVMVGLSVVSVQLTKK